MSTDRLRPMVIGEVIRDWSIDESPVAFFPYGSDLDPIAADSDELRPLWPWRTNLSNNMLFGGKTKVQGGLGWHEFGRLTTDKLRTPLTITFAFVATHNHFVLDRGGKVFNRSAPIIKLPETATEEDHLALLAYLNSSTAAFVLRQICHSKGAQGVNEGHKSETWEQFLEFSGSMVSKIPLPPDWQSLADLGRCIVDHAEALARAMPSVALAQWSERDEASLSLDPGTAVPDGLERLVALQEELDWKVYELFGLLSDDERRAHAERTRALFPSPWHELDPTRRDAWQGGLPPGHRPFEVRLTAGAPTQWFVRNQYAVPEPDHLDRVRERATSSPRDALDLFRYEQTTRSPTLATLEQPEHKRRWTVPDVAADRDRAVRDWTLATLEVVMRPAEARTIPRATTEFFEHDPARTTALAERHLGDPLTWFRGELAKEAIPFLAAYRHTEPGLEKRAAWEKTWDLQRREDGGEAVGPIPVPPKYDQKDYRDATYWRLRGKLDVPKERFVSYPGCESDEDAEPLYGWAGWTPEQRAKALATLYYHRKTEEGWDKPRLTPLLAGLQELQLWLDLWHAGPADDYGGLTPADYYRGFWTAECQAFGLTPEDLKAWRPPEKVRGRRGPKRTGTTT